MNAMLNSAFLSTESPIAGTAADVSAANTVHRLYLFLSLGTISQLKSAQIVTVKLKTEYNNL